MNGASPGARRAVERRAPVGKDTINRANGELPRIGVIGTGAVGLSLAAMRGRAAEATIMARGHTKAESSIRQRRTRHIRLSSQA